MSRRRRTALAGVLDAVTAALPEPTTEPGADKAASAATAKVPDADKAQVADKAQAATKTQTATKTKHTSLYLPPAALRQLKELALLDGCKPHDIIVAALDAYFERRGRPSVAELRQRED